jgi:hypothetical protein
MSKTKRKTPRREFETAPMTRHLRKRRCDGCGEWFEPEEISEDRDVEGRVLGRFCGGCI